MEKVSDISDLKEILILQKIAFRSEAERNNNFDIPPLHQTLEEIENEYFNGVVFLKHEKEGKIVASIRAYIDQNSNCQIGRLIVDPRYQKQGIGTRLMHKIEKLFKSCKEYKIFTGAKSDNVIALYKKLGYKIESSKSTHDISVIYMHKMNL